MYRVGSVYGVATFEAIDAAMRPSAAVTRPGAASRVGGPGVFR